MHEGHRDRVKKRFRQEGLDHFSDIQALELLLFYGIPRVDTNPIAMLCWTISAAFLRCWRPALRS